MTPRSSYTVLVRQIGVSLVYRLINCLARFCFIFSAERQRETPFLFIDRGICDRKNAGRASNDRFKCRSASELASGNGPVKAPTDGPSNCLLANIRTTVLTSQCAMWKKKSSQRKSIPSGRAGFSGERPTPILPAKSKSRRVISLPYRGPPALGGPTRRRNRG